MWFVSTCISAFGIVGRVFFFFLFILYPLILHLHLWSDQGVSYLISGEIVVVYVV